MFAIHIWAFIVSFYTLKYFRLRNCLSCREALYSLKGCAQNIRSTSIATCARMYSRTVITVFGQKAKNHESSKQLKIGVKLCLIIW